ncbi:hypothetical protein ACMZYS_18775, partial [Pseudomonas syringae pv. actinidiae]|uniref:hypothetical protein n=1 Tax=Pseudomonas syringae TaxID=317 RepID=UPI0039EFB115
RFPLHIQKNAAQQSGVFFSFFELPCSNASFLAATPSAPINHVFHGTHFLPMPLTRLSVMKLCADPV